MVFVQKSLEREKKLETFEPFRLKASMDQRGFLSKWPERWLLRRMWQTSHYRMPIWEPPFPCGVMYLREGLGHLHLSGGVLPHRGQSYELHFLSQLIGLVRGMRL